MHSDPIRSLKNRLPRWRPQTVLQRFRRAENGTAAIEFGILAFPFFLLVFATIEVFIAFAGEQLLENAVDAMGRQLRTGQITYNMGRATDLTQDQFRTKFCGEINLMIKCVAKEDPADQKLYLDVREFSTFANVPKGIPRKNNALYADLDSSAFAYKPGGPGTINIVRAYYRWEVMTDLVRPYITNIRPDGKSPKDYMMVATAAFRNEAYP